MEIAIESANVIVMVVNVQEGIVPLDNEVAMRLRRSGKPVFVAVNKADDARAEAGSAEFTALGFDRVFSVSAIHGLGIGPLIGEALKLIPPAPPADPDAETKPLEVIKLAIVGRPNVGKSSIINSLTRSERVIVSPIPGTTRDSVDVPFEVETEGVRQRFILIDTAGMRKSRRVNDSIEFFSVKRSEDSIGRADIAILVLDAESGILEQDKKIADKIVEEAKACIVVVNKWDLVEDSVRKAREEEIERRRVKDRRDHTEEKSITTLGQFGEWVQKRLFFLDYAPVIFTSAHSGFNLERLLEAVRYVAAQLKQNIPTAILNRTLRDAIEVRQPISATGHFLKFFYATQVKTVPPTFLLFVNRDELFSPSYRKYLSEQIRKAFGYEGCPVLLVPKTRPKTIDSVRRDKSDKKPSSRAGDRSTSGSEERSTSRSEQKPRPGPRPARSGPKSRTGARDARIASRATRSSTRKPKQRGKHRG